MCTWHQCSCGGPSDTALAMGKGRVAGTIISARSIFKNEGEKSVYCSVQRGWCVQNVLNLKGNFIAVSFFDDFFFFR